MSTSPGSCSPPNENRVRWGTHFCDRFTRRVGQPAIDGMFGDAQPPRYVLGFAPCLQLLQRSDHLGFRVPALRHLPSPFLGPKSYSDLFGKKRSVSCISPSP